jgi:hypothetical protein
MASSNPPPGTEGSPETGRGVWVEESSEPDGEADETDWSNSDTDDRQS